MDIDYQRQKSPSISSMYRTKLTAQTFHAYESTFLQDYKENYNKYPILSDNCDPEYRK